MAEWLSFALAAGTVIFAIVTKWWFQPGRELRRIYQTAVRRCLDEPFKVPGGDFTLPEPQLGESLFSIVRNPTFLERQLDTTDDFAAQRKDLVEGLVQENVQTPRPEVEGFVQSFFQQVRRGLSDAKNPSLRKLAAHIDALGPSGAEPAGKQIETNGVPSQVPLPLQRTTRQIIHSMPPSERVKLFHQWETLKGGFPPVPDDGQVAPGNVIQGWPPIDLEPMNRLLEHLGLDEYRLPAPPMRQEAYERLRAAKDEVSDAIFHRLDLHLRTAENLDAETQHFLDGVYEYLSEEDHPPRGARNFVAFVPGYRQRYRAETAARFFLEGIVNRIYLTGDQPRLDADNKDFVWQIGEAQAMEIFLTDVHDGTRDRIKPSDIIVDDRARTTVENVLFSLSSMKRLKKELGELKVLIVTSPFHLRRTHLMIQRFMALNPNLVDEVRRVASFSRFMKKDWYRSAGGVRAYVTEYWKVHGGRIIGEF